MKHQARIFRDAPTKGLVIEFAREIEADRNRLPGQAVLRAEAIVAPLSHDPKRAPFYAIGPELVPITKFVYGRITSR